MGKCTPRRRPADGKLSRLRCCCTISVPRQVPPDTARPLAGRHHLCRVNRSGPRFEPTPPIGAQIGQGLNWWIGGRSAVRPCFKPRLDESQCAAWAKSADRSAPPVRSARVGGSPSSVDGNSWNRCGDGRGRTHQLRPAVVADRHARDLRRPSLPECAPSATRRYRRMIRLALLCAR